jgi:hypothetical protein
VVTLCKISTVALPVACSVGRSSGTLRRLAATLFGVEDFICAISWLDHAQHLQFVGTGLNKSVADVFISQARAQAPRGLWFFRTAMSAVPSSISGLSSL